MKDSKMELTFKDALFYLLLASVIFVVTIYAFQGIVNYAKGKIDNYNSQQINTLLKESSTQNSYDKYQDLLDLLKYSNALDEDNRLTIKPEREGYYWVWNEKYNEISCEKYDDIITIADVESKDYNPWLDDKEINKVLINRQGIIFGGYYLIYTKYDIDPLKMITNDEIYDKYFVNYSKLSKLYKKLIDYYYKNENIYLCDFKDNEIVWYENNNGILKLVNSSLYNEDIDNVIVLNGTKTIPKLAFKNYKKIRKIHLPTTLISVDDDAFIDCDGLETIYHSYNEYDVKQLRSFLF
ncbi:MAG: leucine-rich repeat protein [Candidatus Caccosoma sp.]|nr:leucine-rich repeat protein [Candidatus Caccosoma sp.]